MFEGDHMWVSPLSESAHEGLKTSLSVSGLSVL